MGVLSYIAPQITQSFLFSFLLVIQSEAKDPGNINVDVHEIFRTSPQQHVFTALRSVLSNKTNIITMHHFYVIGQNKGIFLVVKN